MLATACPECGFDAGMVHGKDVAAMLDQARPRYLQALRRADVRRRPAPTMWSVLEYSCHVRDVNEVMTTRAQLMLSEHDPLFANWDQDETAITQRYWEQEPAAVAAELDTSFATAIAVFGGIEAQWQRPGRRSNGSVFTVDSLARYYAHDIFHHLHDIQE